MVASSAVYRDGYWIIKEADIIKKPKEISFLSNGINTKELSNIKILEGFRPKMLDQVYDGKVNFTIMDGFDAMFLLDKQNVDTRSIKSALYKIFIYPFFIPSLIIIIFFFVPVSSRSFNVSLFSSMAILSTLSVWGVLFMLIELSNNKTIPSEVGIVLPVFILFLLAMRSLKVNQFRR